MGCGDSYQVDVDSQPNTKLSKSEKKSRDLMAQWLSKAERLPNVTNVPKTHWSHNLISFNQVRTF